MFPGDPGVPQQQFGAFFPEISRLQNLSVERLAQRNLRAALPQIDIGFGQAARGLNEGLASRGLGFGGVAAGARGGLANLQGLARSNAALQSLFAAEDQRNANLQQALNLFAGLFAVRTGQASINIGADQARGAERRSQRAGRSSDIASGAGVLGDLFAAGAELLK